MSATLALGTAQFGTPYGVANSVGRLDDATVAAILAAAFELGVRVIDTAAAYGDAEERIGRINLPHDAVVCSKLPPGGDVRASVEASRRRLRRDRIDYYLVHRAGDVTAQLVDHLAAEHAAGHIGAAGISVYTADEAALLDSHAALSAIQFPYNLLDRRITPPAGATCFARSALLQGLFVLDPDALPANVRHAAPTLRRLHSLLRDFAVTPADVALAFVASTPGIHHVVVGVESVAQLRANAAAVDRPLPAGLRDAIERELADVPIDVIDPRRWGVPPA